MRATLQQVVLVLLLLIGGGAAVRAEVAERPAPKGEVLSLLPSPQTTSHSITLAGRKLDYQSRRPARCRCFPARATSRRRSSMSPTRCGRRTAPDPPSGRSPSCSTAGPGAASAYLHLGALGPRIWRRRETASFLPLAAPHRQSGHLARHDRPRLRRSGRHRLQPRGTGRGTHALLGRQAGQLPIGAFIRLFLAQKGRTGSPLFLAGESYGGFRAALLARTLQEDIGISPNGVVLISPALEFMLV